MKQYGFNKATEFTKKQINVIFAKAKKGELKVPKFVISDFYNLADYYGYDDNRSVEESETDILRILDNVFNNNLEKAQELINAYGEKELKLMSRKNREKADLSFI